MSDLASTVIQARGADIPLWGLPLLLVGGLAVRWYTNNRDRDR